jgi:hypothetical protein
MIDERRELAEALKKVTERLPMITRGVIQAARTSQPLSWRRRELEMAISQTRALLDELMLYRTRLGWHDR